MPFITHSGGAKEVMALDESCNKFSLSLQTHLCAALRMIRDNKEAVAQHFKRTHTQIRMCCKYKRLFVDALQHIHHISMQVAGRSDLHCDLQRGSWTHTKTCYALCTWAAILITLIDISCCLFVFCFCKFVLVFYQQGCIDQKRQ